MRTLSLTISFALALAAGSVEAGNWKFLKDVPLTYFTEKDIQLFKNALRKALDGIADGESLSWTNPKTGAGGTVKTLDTQQESQTVCRRVRIANQAKGREGKTLHRFCRQADGQWQLHR